MMVFRTVSDLFRALQQNFYQVKYIVVIVEQSTVIKNGDKELFVIATLGKRVNQN